jgi:hypothetical protein
MPQLCAISLQTSNFSTRTSSIHSRDPLRSASLRATLSLENFLMMGVYKLGEQQPNNSQLSRRVMPAEASWCGKALHRTLQGVGGSILQLQTPSLQKAKKKLIATVANSEIDVCHSKNRTSRFLIATKTCFRGWPFSRITNHQSLVSEILFATRCE